MLTCELKFCAADGSYGVSKDGGTRSFSGLTAHLTGFSATWAYYTALRLPCGSCTHCASESQCSTVRRLGNASHVASVPNTTAYRPSSQTQCDSQAGVQLRAKIIRLKAVTIVNLYKPTVHALKIFIRL